MKILTQSAFSLYDLLIVLALASVGISVAVPSLAALQQKSERDTLRNHLHVSLNHARLQAILNNTSVELCGSIDGATCSQDWSQGWRMHVMNTPEHVVLIQQHRGSATLKWAGFDSRIRFHSNGTSPSSNGRFFQCKGNDIAWQLILNRQGRVRLASPQEDLAEAHRC
ncbi:Tfp pilus assembly protein FimT-like protein [Ectopseudomonas mendocina]|uniref:GspH/FimT family pseudopilin n=1 Tax=Ectopseudomonas mendocina TaxID=300 RepID=UPI0005A0BB57|nr:GspH/FimT family pseudopilin [Pseudomonas mendocina]SUD37222.1 Tfp pilus assembly protein FimT-like protein [Pseudomonas mendocina]